MPSIRNLTLCLAIGTVFLMQTASAQNALAENVEAYETCTLTANDIRITYSEDAQHRFADQLPVEAYTLDNNLFLEFKGSVDKPPAPAIYNNNSLRAAWANEEHKVFVITTCDPAVLHFRWGTVRVHSQTVAILPKTPIQ